MLDAVIRQALRYRTLVLLVSAAALVCGGYLTTTMPIDVFPDLDRPRVVILTECPGLAPGEVETLVTQPIESVVLGATGVQAVRSQSSPGLVVIYVEFDWRTEVRAARQVVQERLLSVGGLLPSGVRPVLAPASSIMGQIMHVGLTRRRGPSGGVLAAIAGTDLVAERFGSGKQRGSIRLWRVTNPIAPQSWQRVPIQRVDQAAHRKHPGAPVSLVVAGRTHSVRFPTPLEEQMELRAVAEFLVRIRLMRISGVAEVLVMGGERKQYQALVDPNRLLEYGVTLQQVTEALRQNNGNASGGFSREGQQERPIRILGRLGPDRVKVLEDLARVPVKSSPKRSVLLSHVANVVEAPQPKRGDASIDGFPGVVITIVKQPHVDTRGLTERIHEALGELEVSLGAEVVIHRDLFQLKNFIDRGIYYVGEAMLTGGLLVVLVLAVFLVNFRTTLITLTAIPLSLVLTTLVFRLIGALTNTVFSINVMTLGGIAVAMGELVDDAIVDVENIFRRLREDRALGEPRSTLQVVYEASREIRGAVVFGTLVVILAFMPLFAMSGVEGRLFAPLGLAYVVSILSSLVVSLTVTPVLSYYLLPGCKAMLHTRDAWLPRVLKWCASHLIRLSMARPGSLLLVSWLLVGVSVWLLLGLGADFLPKFDEGSIQVNVTLTAGSSLAASNEAAAIIDRRLRLRQAGPKNPDGEILHFMRRTGRAELDEHAQPVYIGEYLLSMNPRVARPRDEVLKDILDDLKQELPGVDLESDQPLSHLISHMLSGVAAQLAIKIHGDDLDVLQRVARDIKQSIRSVPGLTTPVIESQLQVDELHVVLRADDLARFGLSRAYVADFVQTALRGEVLSQVVDGTRRFDLVIKLVDAFRSDYFNLGQLRIDLPGGEGQITLSDVADLRDDAMGPNQVLRENGRRRLVVRCNTRGRDMASVVEEVQSRIRASVTLPRGYFVEYGGQFESQRSATRLISILAVVSCLGMFVVLMILHPSARIVLQILNALPTAFIGGVLALVLTGQTLTVASLVGFVSLGGIAVRNGILLVTHYFHLMSQEGQPFSREMILRGSLERLSPVLMTALTAAIGLVPIVVGGHKPGLEILYPVATVILGGLCTSTLCEFLIHPGLFWKFSGQDAQRLVRTDRSDDLSSEPARSGSSEKLGPH